MSKVARKTKVYGAVDQRLHHQKDIGRPRPTDGRGHGYEPFITNLELMPERTEESFRLLALNLGGLGRRIPNVDALADLGRGVWHHSDDRGVAKPFAQRLGRRPRDDRDQQLVVANLAAELRQDAGHDLWLDAQDHDVALGGSRGIIGSHVNGVLLA